MTRQLLLLSGQRKIWVAAVVVVLCLLGGLHAGDMTARGAARSPESMQSTLAHARADVRRAHQEALAAELGADAAARRTARAALAARQAGEAGAAALLPKRMRFACSDGDARRCVVVADREHRSIILVWPAYRPPWAATIGLPAGACDGVASAPGHGLSDCERAWLHLPPRPPGVG